MRMKKKNKFVRSPGTRELGGYLPAPGAPEPIGDYVAVGSTAMGDCGCHGTKAKAGLGVLGALGGDAKTVIVRVGTLAAAYVAFKEASKAKGKGKWLLYAIAAAAAVDSVEGSSL